ncbi:unnamed protein product, partial [Prorocentrum cordatum]
PWARQPRGAAAPSAGGGAAAMFAGLMGSAPRARGAGRGRREQAPPAVAADSPARRRKGAGAAAASAAGAERKTKKAKGGKRGLPAGAIAMSEQEIAAFKAWLGQRGDQPSARAKSSKEAPVCGGGADAAPAAAPPAPRPRVGAESTGGAPKAAGGLSRNCLGA